MMRRPANQGRRAGAGAIWWKIEVSRSQWLRPTPPTKVDQEGTDHQAVGATGAARGQMPTTRVPNPSTRSAGGPGWPRPPPSRRTGPPSPGWPAQPAGHPARDREDRYRAGRQGQVDEEPAPTGERPGHQVVQLAPDLGGLQGAHLASGGERQEEGRHEEGDLEEHPRAGPGDPEAGDGRAGARRPGERARGRLVDEPHDERAPADGDQPPEERAPLKPDRQPERPAEERRPGPSLGPVGHHARPQIPGAGQEQGTDRAQRAQRGGGRRRTHWPVGGSGPAGWPTPRARGT